LVILFLSFLYKENHETLRFCARRGFLVESPLQTWQAAPLPVLPIGRRNLIQQAAKAREFSLPIQFS